MSKKNDGLNLGYDSNPERRSKGLELAVNIGIHFDPIGLVKRPQSLPLLPRNSDAFDTLTCGGIFDFL